MAWIFVLMVAPNSVFGATTIISDDFSGPGTNPADFGYYLSANGSSIAVDDFSSSGARSIRFANEEGAATRDGFFQTI